jgi:hypothetical protein
LLRAIRSPSGVLSLGPGLPLPPSPRVVVLTCPRCGGTRRVGAQPSLGGNHSTRGLTTAPTGSRAAPPSTRHVAPVLRSGVQQGECKLNQAQPRLTRVQAFLRPRPQPLGLTRASSGRLYFRILVPQLCAFVILNSYEALTPETPENGPACAMDARCGLARGAGSSSFATCAFGIAGARWL